MRCSSNAMLPVSACLVLLFHISVEGAPTTRNPMVTFALATGSPIEKVDACERYGYEFCNVGMVAPDDTDCEYFYRCDQGHWIRIQCAEQTYFDVETYRCLRTFTCQDKCPPYTGAPFPDPGADPRGPCPGTDGSNCNVTSNYPDKHSCSWYHNCLGAGHMVQQQCSDQTVFDLDTRNCISPDADFNCFPRCPGITFPDTSSEAMTTYTTPMVTTQMPTSEAFTGESTIDPNHTVPFGDTDATIRDISLPTGPTDSTERAVTQQSSAPTIAPTEPMTESTTEQQGDSTAIIIGGAAGGFVLAVAAVYILHTKGVITLPFTANSAAKASSASGNARPPNSNIFGGKATPPKVTHVPKALKY